MNSQTISARTHFDGPVEPEAAGAPATAIAPGADRVSELEAELADMRDRWIRAEAETANVRSRSKRDVEEARQYAIQKFAADVVDVADNVERGVGSLPAKSATDADIINRLREGFTGIERSFIGLLARNGIIKHDPTGTAFDPALHQAMEQRVAAGHKPGTVLQATTPSWTLNGRLLRPAMVVVSTAPPPPPPPPPPQAPPQAPGE
jgi:molecular chaperone GrpE